MKRLTKIVLVGLLAVSSINAKEIFDLQDQYFENSYKKSGKASLYDLKNIQVSMTNIYQTSDGEYRTNSNQSGTLIGKLKQPLENFSVNTKVKIGSTYSDRTSSIVLVASNGNQLSISFDSEKIFINDKKFDTGSIYTKTLNININRSAKQFEVIINGQVFMKINDENFTQLKNIEFAINSATYSDLL